MASTGELPTPKPTTGRTTRGRGAPPGRLLATLALSVAALLLGSFALAQAPTYFIQADTVRGAMGAQGAVCVGNSVFMQGEQVVFRAYVFDAATGEPLTTERVEADGIKVYGVIDGERVAELALLPHPPESEQTEVYWAAGWSIPADYPTGNYAWSVQVEDTAGNTAEYLPMGHTVGLGTLMVLEPGAAPAGPPAGPPGGAPGGGEQPPAPGGGTGG